MKRWIAVGLLVVSMDALAVDCGTTVSSARIQEMLASMEEPSEALIRHSSSLAMQAADASKSGRIRDFNNLLMETNAVDFMHTTGGGLQSTLTTAQVLAIIRDRMVNRADRNVVSEYVQLWLATAERVAESSQQLANDAVPHFSTPGIAKDVAKMRDRFEAIARELEKCRKR